MAIRRNPAVLVKILITTRPATYSVMVSGDPK
jgi:hypothetical protein